MSFTSISFFVFFSVFFIVYWFLCNRQVKLQNFLLLIGSYVFYGWADWRFLIFLVSISALNFFLGIYIEKTDSAQTKKWLLIIGLVQGIGGLFLFKYFDFFVLSLDHLFNTLHLNVGIKTLNLFAPLGISFFTFKTISYLLDVSKKKIPASKNWVAFFIYVSFFPTIMAGPIDRAKTFVPQLLKLRVFNYDQAAEAMRQILWGLFKKSVIADNAATITNPIFDNCKDMSGSSLFLGAILYTFQMYADFSGYSDMAIGFSRLLGLNVTKNFDYPFFSQNIAEYWRRWHISLTSWLTEYVFTPLSISFRDLGDKGLMLAIIINFTLIGIWHGANWTYVLFGLLHGIYYIPLIIKGTMNKKKKIANGKKWPSFKELRNVLGTFLLVAFTNVIFRSDSVSAALSYYKGLFSTSLFTMPGTDLLVLLYLVVFIFFMLFIEWFGRTKEFAISQFSNNKWSRVVRWSCYILVFIFIVVFKASEQQFIYLKF